MRTCSICQNHRRRQIDQALVSGEPYRSVAKRFEVGPSAVLRHKSHVLPAVLDAKRVEDAVHTDSLLAQIDETITGARRLAALAEKAKDYRTAIAGIRELRGSIELLAKLRGELPAQPVAVTVVPKIPDMTLEEAAEILKRAPALAKRAQELGLFSEGKTSPLAGGPTLSIAK